jgi:hypothetical protein
MVAPTLKELATWFNEPTNSPSRPKLLSKLAVLELCGWLEVEFDRLIRLVETGRLNDAIWIDKNVINKTSGFEYDKHWRPMLCKVVGEVFARRVEDEMETSHPGELDQLKQLLRQLWKDRCSFAHADINTNISTQISFNAPSMTISQHTKLVQILSRYETALLNIMAKI